MDLKDGALAAARALIEQESERLEAEKYVQNVRGPVDLELEAESERLALEEFVGQVRTPTVLVGLVGPARAGKDTVARHLMSTRGFTHFKFATRLKAICRVEFLLTDDQIEGGGKEVPDPRWIGPAGVFRTPREIMQLLGTQGFRAIDPDFWVKRTLTELDFELSYGSTKFVISDVRYFNEAEAIRKRGGKIIRVRRTDQHPRDSNLGHISEVELWDIAFDGEISAAPGDLEALRHGTDLVLEQLGL